MIPFVLIVSSSLHSHVTSLCMPSYTPLDNVVPIHAVLLDITMRRCSGRRMTNRKTSRTRYIDRCRVVRNRRRSTTLPKLSDRASLETLPPLGRLLLRPPTRKSEAHGIRCRRSRDPEMPHPPAVDGIRSHRGKNLSITQRAQETHHDFSLALKESPRKYTDKRSVSIPFTQRRYHQIWGLFPAKPGSTETTHHPIRSWTLLPAATSARTIEQERNEVGHVKRLFGIHVQSQGAGTRE
jgi:hypothetical protein